MYYYLSFLRPPPASVHLGEGTITITPQIANDLRTELKDDAPTDIYYTWQRVPSTIPTHTTHPTKLTTYQPPINTYKPISLALPASAKPSETWRLGLFAPPATGVRGWLDGLDRHVCGVWSEPIMFLGGRPKNKNEKQGSAVGKQTRVFREWDVAAKSQFAATGTGSSASDGILRIVEQTSFDLDKKIWDSGLALSAWLHSHLSATPPPRPPLIDRYLSRLFPASQDRAVRVVELGAGTGLVSFALGSAVRRHGQTAPLDIYATDLDSALPLIDENSALNAHLWSRTDGADQLENVEERPEGSIGSPSNEIAIHSEVLDWDEPLPSWVHESPIDLIIAADVTYNTASFPALVTTLVNLLRPDPSKGGEPPMLLLAYKERDASERELWGMAQARGLNMAMVDIISGHETDGKAGATEIWVGGMGESV